MIANNGGKIDIHPGITLICLLANSLPELTTESSFWPVESNCIFAEKTPSSSGMS